ncbi:MAG: hypothetical protein M1836_007984 [Candelina mexicana]|nr:MAG: hypothetical protein M1836_007984 [Candelina mexicana]
MEQKTPSAPLSKPQLAKRSEDLAQQDEATSSKSAQAVEKERIDETEADRQIVKQLTRELARLERRKQKRISEGMPPRNVSHQTMHRPISRGTIADSPAGTPQSDGKSDDD